MIARVVDGLPLVGSMQEDEQVRTAHKSAKIRKLSLSCINAHKQW